MKLSCLQFIKIQCRLFILFGKESTGHYPFMAWMGTCGASLIHESWILTAAHCATKFLENPSSIYFGSNIRESGWKCEHEAVYRHPNFKHNKELDRVINDIAVIKLREPVPKQYGKPIIVPKLKSLTNYNQFDAKIIGWGYNNVPFLSPSEKLFEANLKMSNTLPFQFCRIPGKLCSAVITEEGPRMAPGDSGGPLFFQVGGEFIQIGIITVLWLHPQRIYVNEFTDVAFYSDWIFSTIKTNS